MTETPDKVRTALFVSNLAKFLSSLILPFFIRFLYATINLALDTGTILRAGKAWRDARINSSSLEQFFCSSSSKISSIKF